MQQGVHGACSGQWSGPGGQVFEFCKCLQLIKSLVIRYHKAGAGLDGDALALKLGAELGELLVGGGVVGKELVVAGGVLLSEHPE